MVEKTGYKYTHLIRSISWPGEYNEMQLPCAIMALGGIFLLSKLGLLGQCRIETRFRYLDYHLNCAVSQHVSKWIREEGTTQSDVKDSQPEEVEAVIYPPMKRLWRELCRGDNKLLGRSKKAQDCIYCGRS